MVRKYDLLFLLLISALLLTACTGKSDALTEQETVSIDLQIDTRTLTGEAAFIDVTQDDTSMQLIARKDDAGQVRLAFNTCQSCAGSPYAWFEDLGDGNLQCQNCRQTFPLDSVGIDKAQGCNPVTITDFTVEDDIVTVSGALIKANRERFVNWKKFD